MGYVYIPRIESMKFHCLLIEIRWRLSGKMDAVLNNSKVIIQFNKFNLIAFKVICLAFKTINKSIAITFITNNFVEKPKSRNVSQ